MAIREVTHSYGTSYIERDQGKHSTNTKEDSLYYYLIDPNLTNVNLL